MSDLNYREENINVILNKIIVTDSKEEIAYSIIRKVLNNDFCAIKFRFNDGYPNRLDVLVYKSKKDLKNNKIFFCFHIAKWMEK